jgi:hypothetical protein
VIFGSFSLLLSAQDGRWVAYELDTIGSGANYHDCGDGCIGYVPTTSQYILIFDIRIGEWELVDLHVVQNFNYLETEGNVLMARSEDLLFGYSSTLGAWDTIHYEGTVLSNHSNQLFRSYGCSDSLAFFITDQQFYVFDGSLGYWQEYDYGYPADFGAGYFYPKDDCIIMTIVKTDFYAGIMNVAYSSHTHTFNKIENGCLTVKSTYDHGYAGVYDKTGEGKEVILVGYSAFDNQFDVVPYSAGENEAGIYFYDSDIIAADDFTAFTFGFRTVVTPYELVRVTFYGYSTLLGTWTSITYDIDWEAESYYGNGHVGGQCTVDLGTEKDPQYYRFFFYSAVNGMFNNVYTDLEYTSTTSTFRIGGSVFCVFDSSHGWGYNPVNDMGNTIELVHDNFAHVFAADDYATFCRWSQPSDTMRMYIYNGNSNRWSWIDTPKHWDQTGVAAPHIYLYKAWPENNIIVYSSILDTIMQRDLPDSIFVYSEINGILACARSENQSFLFNTERCTIYEKGFEFNQNGMGTRSAAFYDTTSGRILHGYSSLTDQWTTRTISDEPYYCYDPGYIGLVSAMVGISGYGKFYAYNSFGDSWVELVPEGKYVAHRVGNSTALVIRSTHIYAFDPYTATGDNEEPGKPDQKNLRLQQNHPNPFNSSTTINYELTRPSAVELRIYNSLGQAVRLLVNEHQYAGRWSVTWDGRNGNNQPVPSGIYIYQLKAGETRTSRRMILYR